MDEEKKKKSPILAIWRRLQSGDIQLSKRIKDKIKEIRESYPKKRQ